MEIILYNQGRGFWDGEGFVQNPDLAAPVSNLVFGEEAFVPVAQESACIRCTAVYPASQYQVVAPGSELLDWEAAKIVEELDRLDAAMDDAPSRHLLSEPSITDVGTAAGNRQLVA